MRRGLILLCLSVCAACASATSSTPGVAPAGAIGSSTTTAPGAGPLLQPVTPAELAAVLRAPGARLSVVNVWATWCEPCKVEMPEMQALHARHAADGFTVIGISPDAMRLAGEVRRLVGEFRLTYPNIHDPQNTVSQIFKVRGYPTSILIGRDGGMLWRRDGLIEPGDPELSAALASALAVPRT